VTTKGWRLLFSYGILVASESRCDGKFYRTENKALTRSMKRHITRWLEGRDAHGIPQSLLEQAAGLV
jgi:hypothetical protein